jgi:hypothetical protein
MASRPILTPFTVIGGDSDIDGSMAANITSSPTIMQNLSMVSYDISWSGTSPIGEISVEVSNTYSQNVNGSVRNPGTWSALPMNASTAVTGNTGSGFIDIDANAGYAIRLVYTRISGTGTMLATVNGKVM